MKGNLINKLMAIVVVFLILTSCTKYVNPEPKFEEYEQEIERTVQRKVLIISVDGLVGQEIKKKVPTNIAELMKNAKYSFDALADPNTSDASSWATMMTGYSSSRHNITSESYLPSPNSNDPHGEVNFVPSFIYRLEDINASIRTSVVMQEEGLANILLMDADDNALVDTDEKAKNEGIAILKSASPNVCIIQFRDVLKAGISAGFSMEQQPYADAVAKVDTYIGEIIASLKSREDYIYEDWLIIVNSSHGGLGKQYGGESLQERNIFTLYNQKDFVSQELKAEIMSTMRFWGYSTSPLGIRALNTDADASDYFNLDSDGELTIEAKYSWASPKTVEWPSNNTPIGDNTFWYAPLAAKKRTIGIGNVGWGIYTWGSNITFSVSDGSKYVDIQTSRANGVWGVVTGRIRKTSSRNAEISLFRDGILVSTTTLEGFNFSAINNEAFVVGYPNAVNWELPDFKLAGLRIWKKALTNEEIRENTCKVELTDQELSENKVIGEWYVKNADQQKIKNRVNQGKDLFFQGIAPKFSSEQYYTPCELDVSSVLIQNSDVASQVFYWLGVVPNENWRLEGSVFLTKFELEFLK